MRSNAVVTISDGNLSHAWGHGFLRALDCARRPGFLPFVISISSLDNDSIQEDPAIRSVLDTTLKQLGKYSCDESAMVIFPRSFWTTQGRPHIDQLTNLYMTKYLPRLRARDRANSRGTYFERMINFQGAKRTKYGIQTGVKNQLRHIVEIWDRDRQKGRRPRRSALQVSCFDPVKDHNGAALGGFPCLQQLSLDYDDSDGIILNAYYPTQYMFDRAYGNYLGLCHLGQFIATELNQRFVRLNGFIGSPEIGRAISRRALGALEDIVRQRTQGS